MTLMAAQRSRSLDPQDRRSGSPPPPARDVIAHTVYPRRGMFHRPSTDTVTDETACHVEITSLLIVGWIIHQTKGEG